MVNRAQGTESIRVFLRLPRSDWSLRWLDARIYFRKMVRVRVRGS